MDMLLVPAFENTLAVHQTASRNASSTQIAPPTKHATEKNVQILVQGLVDSTLNAVLFCTNPSATVLLVILEIHSKTVLRFHQNLHESKSSGTLAIHLHAAQMQNVLKETELALVFVYQNILVTHTPDVDLNALPTPTVQQIRHACEISVEIHVRVFVDITRIAEFTIMSQLVPVTKVTKETHSKVVNKDLREYLHLNLSGIHAFHLPVDPTVNAEFRTISLCALVRKLILEVLPTVDLNVLLALNVLKTKRVSNRNV